MCVCVCVCAYSREIVPELQLWLTFAHCVSLTQHVPLHGRHVPGMLATCAIDKTVKLWDTSSCVANDSSVATPPVPCGSRDMGVGKLYTVNFYPSSPWLLGTGGGGNQLSLWDLSGEAPLRKRFGDRVAANDSGTIDADHEGEDDENEAAKEKDFEAMMAAGDAAADKVREASKSANNNRKKGGKKNKKKAHRAGR